MSGGYGGPGAGGKGPGDYSFGRGYPDIRGYPQAGGDPQPSAPSAPPAAYSDGDRGFDRQPPGYPGQHPPPSYEPQPAAYGQPPTGYGHQPGPRRHGSWNPAGPGSDRYPQPGPQRHGSWHPHGSEPDQYPPHDYPPQHVPPMSYGEPQGRYPSPAQEYHYEASRAGGPPMPDVYRGGYAPPRAPVQRSIDPQGYGYAGPPPAYSRHEAPPPYSAAVGAQPRYPSVHGGYGPAGGAGAGYPPQGRPAAPGRSDGAPRDTAEKRRRAVKAFDKFDRDRSGYLDIREFLRAMETLGARMSRDDALAVFAIADSNRNQKISRDEFIQHYAANY